MTIGYFLSLVSVWGTLAVAAVLIWAVALSVQLFTTWHWATELRRWKTTRRRSYFTHAQPRYF